MKRVIKVQIFSECAVFKMLISFISAKKSKTPSKKVWLDSSITYQVFYYYTGQMDEVLVLIFQIHLL
jgi:hypothetical protein